jgi:hypothetical protein
MSKRHTPFRTERERMGHPATAFGRVELFSFFRSVTRPSKGRSSTSLPLSGGAAVEEPGSSELFIFRRSLVGRRTRRSILPSFGRLRRWVWEDVFAFSGGEDS